MKETFLDILRCQVCRKNSFHIEEVQKNEIEIQRGKILCDNCNTLYEIKDGIVDFLKDVSLEVRRERKAVDTEEYLWDDKAHKYKINKDSIERFKEQFLLLPEGDGSHFFKREGCFQPIAEASHRFYDTLNLLRLKGNEKILSLGDGFGYASYKFAQYSCWAVALDISKYLLASDLYIKKAYFDRIFSDMHDLPFIDNTFDVVFCSAILHHSKNLRKAFSEIYRVLKEGGRMFIINESSRGVFEKINPFFDDLKERGYSDTAYTISEWMRALHPLDFKDIKIEFLSLVDDYIKRKENKDAELTNLLRFAYFLRRHRGIEKILLILLKYPRILFRPKSWRMIAVK